MKTREEMHAEIRAGLTALLAPYAGKLATSEARTGMLLACEEYLAGLPDREAVLDWGIAVETVDVDADGVAHVRFVCSPEFMEMWKRVAP